MTVALIAIFMSFNSELLEKLTSFDQTFQDVKEFENHPIVRKLGWDLALLRSLIDAKMLGGGYNRSQRCYVTSEMFIYAVYLQRIEAIKSRLTLEERISMEQL